MWKTKRQKKDPLSPPVHRVVIPPKTSREDAQEEIRAMQEEVRRIEARMERLNLYASVPQGRDQYG